MNRGCIGWVFRWPCRSKQFATAPDQYCLIATFPRLMLMAWGADTVTPLIGSAPGKSGAVSVQNL